MRIGSPVRRSTDSRGPRELLAVSLLAAHRATTTSIRTATLALMLTASAVTAAGASEVVIGEFIEGFSWEDGGWAPPLVQGDELHMVGVFEGINAPPIIVLPWEPKTYVYTFWLRGLTSEMDVVNGDSRSVWYGGDGVLGIYREPHPGNHQYGSNPPNATAPSTFADGELVLEMSVPLAVVQHNSVQGNASIGFDSATYVRGSFYAELSANCGLCQAFATQDADVNAPPGYDFRWGIPLRRVMLVNTFGTPVEETSWGQMKVLYR